MDTPIKTSVETSSATLKPEMPNYDYGTLNKNKHGLKKTPSRCCLLSDLENLSID